ncbi:MAG: cytochrome c assembly protein [Bacteroidetes bacterium]|jgi:cytochrome c-type biogenesis protein CcmF|nr:cytochrome c assembly protein [Bacteroidota bacterium]
MIFGRIAYEGEHLIYGEIGTLAIIASFIFSIIGFIAYFNAIRAQKGGTSPLYWKNLGRISFGVHGLSIFAIMGILFYLLINRHYEYAYVYDHTSDSLPFKYIFSAFWEGQEGSFLLWAFWHVVLGSIFMFYRGKFEANVLAVVSLVQIFITSMLLGLYLGVGPEAFKIGINPFNLLRDSVDAPIFTNADYLSLIEGRGLNALLQNYWMTIHPPTLFLGFASTTIPFAFALGALWEGDYKKWMGPALPWAAFSAGILGLGILMGGAWAYEALTFGGYWAWDPVENMSLVPWLMLVAGIHSHLVARSTGHSLKATFVFYILTFFLVVYSTFLVRSGILEETSVHAFVESGLETQLLIFLLFFPILAFITYIYHFKKIPGAKKEEQFQSREFWMFTGTMVLGISAILITYFTSLPVINVIASYFDPLHEPLVINDPIEHYNKNQLWIALLIGLLSGIGQWTRYHERNIKLYRKKLFAHLGIAAGISFILTVVFLQWLHATAWQYQLLLFAGFFAILTNTDHLISIFKSNPKTLASWFSHAGFGIMIIGILASGLNKEIISTNMFAQRGLLGLDEETLQENIILLKGSPMVMNGYKATYEDDSMDGTYRTYDIRFTALDSNALQDTFTLRPNIIYNSDFTKVEAYNPDTRRRWNYDIFTHLSGLPPQEMNFEEARKIEDSLDYQLETIPLNDTIQIGESYLFATFTTEKPSHKEYEYQKGDLTVGLKLTCWSNEFTKAETKTPFLLIRNNALFQFNAYFPDTRLKVKLPETFADHVFERALSEKSKTAELKVGDSLQWSGYAFDFRQIQQPPTQSNYAAQENELAIGADFEITNLVTQRQFTLEPVFAIKENEVFYTKDRDSLSQLEIQLARVHPETSSFSFKFSKKEIKNPGTVPIEVAQNVPRSDYIVLSTIKFPGINLFWLGSCMMLLGFFASMFVRWKDTHA